MSNKKKFYPIAATCSECQDLMVTVRPRMFITCKCGKSNIDAGDEYYYRAGGSVEKIWKLRAGKHYTSWRLL